jgi:RimJ/RimL family protein N-acetyltransferase
MPRLKVGGINMSKWQYHHLGVPNAMPRENEHYFEKLKMHHTNFDDNPYGIEWLRFEEDSKLPDLVKTIPHIAFKVDNLEEAIAGKEILIEPNSPSEGVKVAFILDNGAPIEFLEYDESKQVTGFPELETTRLRLRQNVSEDSEILFKMRTDKLVMKYMDTPLMENERQALDMINSLSRRFMEEGIPIWAISLKDDPEARMIGYTGFIDRSHKHHHAEIGYALEVEYWQQGIITEALNSVLNYGFEIMNLHSIRASINPDNIPSLKVLEKFNFQKEAHFRESYFYDGKFFDDVIYCLLKRDFSRN